MSTTLCQALCKPGLSASIRRPTTPSLHQHPEAVFVAVVSEVPTSAMGISCQSQSRQLHWSEYHKRPPNEGRLGRKGPNIAVFEVDAAVLQRQRGQGYFSNGDFLLTGQNLTPHNFGLITCVSAIPPLDLLVGQTLKNENCCPAAASRKKLSFFPPVFSLCARVAHSQHRS